MDSSSAPVRLYVGNLPYQAVASDIEALFTSLDFQVTKVDISTDPFTGRNPSYCFVELPSPAEADRAMAQVTGQSVLGRVVKLNPVTPKSAISRSEPRGKTYERGSPQRFTPNRERGERELDDRERRNQRATPTADSPRAQVWASASSWRTPNAAAGSPQQSRTPDRWTRTDTSDRIRSGLASVPAEPTKRLYVGGLPRLEPQDVATAEIERLFEGYTLEAISKLISPTPAALAAANANSSGDPQRKQTAGNLYYAFVDLPSIEEADAAAAALNGRSMPWGGRVRVNRAKGVSGKLVREQGPGAAGEAKE